LSDELKTIGGFANNFKDVARVPESGWANPFTIMDFGTSAVGSGISPIAALLPPARVAARYGILSGPGQKLTAGQPSYGPGLLSQMTPEMLKELEKRGLGGLLGSAYATQ
jgi:hypothetical protein